MKVACFSARSYDKESLVRASQHQDLEWCFFDVKLDQSTLKLADGCDAVCCFVNDLLDRPTLSGLQKGGVRGVALRCAGFNNVDLHACRDLKIKVARVPAYSPYSVAEHTIALLLTLNRKLHKSYNRVREGNFSLSGLMGFDLHGKTVGVVGTGTIGRVVIDILRGFGCRVVAHDPFPECEGVEYMDLPPLLECSRVVTLHLPLTPETHHMIGPEALKRMPQGAILINTSRGGLVDTRAVITALKSGHLGGLAIDVYEEEGDLFFQDLSEQVLQDDIFARLSSFPNALISGHQAFFTVEAMTAIAATTVDNLIAIRDGSDLGVREVLMSHNAD